MDPAVRRTATTPERWAEIGELFDAALERQPSQRPDFLAERCAGDPELRERVETLLASFEQAGSFMERTPEVEETATIAASAGTRDRTALRPGRRLGPYEVQALIGAGGMGEVYRARDTRLDRDVAVKVLPEVTARDPAALARFVRETKAIAAVSHPNILAIHDVGLEDGVSFAVMELLEGESLRGRLAASPLPWREALEIAVAVAEGLAAAHARGIVHRDLKPENVFLTSDGQVKILDFGLAHTAAPGGEDGGSATEEPKTRPGMVMGTIGYMAPEQLRGEPADARSDIFALGCLLYESMAGARPFARPTPVEAIAATLGEEPPACGAPGGLAPMVEEVIARCLQKEPADRFQSARELAAALRATLTVAVPAEAAPSRARGRSAVWLSSVAVLFVAAAAMWLWHGRRTAGQGDAVRLAVLPFENLNRDPDQEYLGDGLAEELVTQLGSLGPQLQVIARDSMARYRSDKDLRRLGRELQVAYVLGGTVRRSGEQVRIATHLVRLSDATEVWTAAYDRRLGDLLVMESEIGLTVARQVHGLLAPQKPARAAPARAVDAQAYEAYLKGHHLLEKRTEASIRKAGELLAFAVAREPGFARAHAARAEYADLAGGFLIPWAEARAIVRAEGMKALQLDDHLAAAHESLARLRFDDWDIPGAESELLRAIALDPSDAHVRIRHAINLWLLGRLKEAVVEGERAARLDPVSADIATRVGIFHLAAGDPDGCLEWSRRALELDPGYWPALGNLGLGHVAKGEYRQGLAELEKATELSGRLDEPLATLGYTYARGGERTKAEQILRELEARIAGGHTNYGFMAIVHAGLGDVDAALGALQRACAQHEQFVPFATASPMLATLRHDPRFQELLRGAGLRW